MADRDEPRPPSPPRSSPAPARGDLALLLCTADAALAHAWARAEPPLGFRLETVPEVRPEHLSAGDPVLVLVDADAVLAADGPLADALKAFVTRCVWTGTAETLDRLGAVRIEQAYDVVVTPTTAGVLTQRLATWARSIRRTAGLEELGRRVEALATQNDHLAARIAHMETQAQVLTRQRERLDHALRRIRQVARLSREINSLDLDQIITVCIQRLPALVDAGRASFYLYDAALDRLVLQGHSHGYAIAERVDLRDNPRSPMAVAVRRGELLLIGEFADFERTADVVLEREFQDRYATRSCILAPLKAGGRVRGVLNLADRKDGRPFDPEIDLPAVEQIAELIGASIYNVELYQEMERRAKTDPLTALANRRGIEESLAHECDRSRRHGYRLTVLLVDVDQLKAVNDRLGHPAGDAVLRNVAATLAETLRSVDVPGRWAGDEFLVVLPDTTEPQAARLAQRLLDHFRQRPTTFGEHKIETSLSIGFAEFDRQETLESLLRRVDLAMYAAKHGGRDRIAPAPPGPDTPP